MSQGAGRCPTCLRSITNVAPPPEAPTGVSAPAPGATRRSAGLSTTPVTGLGRTQTPPPAPSTGPLTPGETFGPRYHVIKLLGIGGMGAVYQAWDTELGVAVAIKVIRPETSPDPEASADLERRFKRELVLARQVTHKNVVRIHDLGEIEGIKYITMPFVNGEDLDSVLKRQGRLPVGKALGIMKQVVAGLQAAHEVGIVHRDLKPANIMMEEEQALVMDFGIARSVSGATMATMAGGVVGTLDYMAPEQARAEQIDQRADIYALGLIFRDLILGRRATTENPVSDLMARMQQAPPSPRSIDPQVPEAVDAIIMKCVQPDAAARFQTTAELAAALENLDADGHPRLPEARTRQAISLPRVLAAVAVVVGMLVGTWWLGRRTAGPRDQGVAHAPVSVLIADFVNKTGDSVFEGALEQALSLGVEGASFITSYPRRDAQRILAQTTPGAKLDETNARLVSAREGINVVLSGTIDGDGSRYRLELKAVEPDGKVINTVSAAASDKAGVLEAIQDLASDVRTELGDTTPESARAQQRETYTAASLEAARTYELAQDLAAARKEKEAVALYQAAVSYDPNFGRAYASWATAAYRLGERQEAEALWNKAMALMGRMTERERYRTLGNYYLGVTRNHEMAIENYQALLQRFPSDGAGLNSLGVAYFFTLDIPKAIEQARKAVAVYPKNGLYRTNLALYFMYAGSFASAAKEAEAVLTIASGFEKAYLVQAIAALAASKPEEAKQAYQRMAQTGSRGASLSALGLADEAMHEGRYADAAAVIGQSLADQQAAGSRRDRAIKRAVLGEVYLAGGRTAEAAKAAREALTEDRQNAIVPAARLLVRAGQDREARDLADELDKQIQKQSRAYARLIKGEMALARARTTEAVDLLTEAKGLADLWLVRFALGRAFEEAGQHAEALSELELCEKRRGEATAVFLDDVPTYRYLGPLIYWRARAQEGLGMNSDAAENYKAYLALRGNVAGDPLAADARKRLPK